MNELLKQLEAAKQRELELLAVIDYAITVLRNHGLFEIADLLFDEPSQALREHEAKLLEEAAKVSEHFSTKDGYEIAHHIRRMAEERRKK